MKISAIAKTRTNKNGTRTVYLRLRHGKKTMLVSTMLEAHYDVVGREFDRREPGARAKTAALCRKIMLFEEIAIGNETKTADEIVESNLKHRVPRVPWRHTAKKKFFVSWLCHMIYLLYLHM